MRLVTANRANHVLSSFIKSNDVTGNVIVPANICQSVIDTLNMVGMNVLYVDIDPNTYCADKGQSEDAAQAASLFLYVHTYGNEGECPAWVCGLKKINPNIIIVDDRCLCLPRTEWCADEDVDLVLFSMGPKKQVSLGGGGMGFVKDGLKYYNMQSIASASPDAICKKFFDLDELVLKTQHTIEHKKLINRIYSSCLPIEIQYPAAYQSWRFNINVPNKDEMLHHIFAAGLFASGHYKPLSEDCPIATEVYNRTINLFNDFYYSEEQARKTCEIINLWLRKMPEKDLKKK
jgi:hypothetical protein